MKCNKSHQKGSSRQASAMEEPDIICGSSMPAVKKVIGLQGCMRGMESYTDACGAGSGGRAARAARAASRVIQVSWRVMRAQSSHAQSGTEKGRKLVTPFVDGDRSEKAEDKNRKVDGAL